MTQLEKWLKRLRDAGIGERTSLYIFAEILFSWMVQLLDLPQQLVNSADKSWATGKIIIGAAVSRLEHLMEELKALLPSLRGLQDALDAAVVACRSVPPRVQIVIDENHLRSQIRLVVAECLDELVKKGVLQRAVLEKYEKGADALRAAADKHSQLALRLERDLPIFKQWASQTNSVYTSAWTIIGLITLAFLLGMGAEYVVLLAGYYYSKANL